MKRALPWFAAALCALGLSWACQAPQVAADPPPNAAPNPAPNAAPNAAPQALPTPDAFRGWPYAYANENVDARAWLLCRVPTHEELEARAKEEEERAGPHARRAVAVRVKPEAMEAYQGRDPMPVGAVVVKEKWFSFSNDGAPSVTRAALDKMGAPLDYAMMIKREPGYDPAHGDWQYVYVEAGKVTEGRLPSCIQCHSQFKARDYLSARGARLKD